MNPSGPVVIVGGGIAGLATAYELNRKGVPFLLLERGTRAGGVVLSEEVDGYTIDAGPDALLAQKAEGVRLCEELGLGERLMPTKPPRLAFIQRGGRLHPLPAASVLGIPTRIGPFLKTRLFTWPGKIRMGAELFVPRRDDGEDESIGAFMTRRFGAEATTYLAEPLLAGIHAGDVDRLSVRALFPRFTDSEAQYGSLLRAFRSQRSSTPADGAFRSLPGGLSELVRALLAALPADSICLHSAVQRIRQQQDGYDLETASGERIRARAIVIAAPAYAAAGMFTDLNPPLAALCGEIVYTSVALVVLAYRREDVKHPLNGSGFVVPRVEHTGIMAGSWLSSKWAHRAPPDRVLLRAFLGGAADPQTLELSDMELVDVATRAMAPLLGIAGRPALTRVYRWERANAQHEVGHLDRVRRIEHQLAKHRGLFVTGSAYRGVGIPDCIADGRAVARQVTQFLQPANP